MDPLKCAEWIIHQHDENPDEAAFDGMSDADILNMLYPLAKAFRSSRQKRVACPTCDGTGEVHSHNPRCPSCSGTGSVPLGLSVPKV